MTLAFPRAGAADSAVGRWDARWKLAAVALAAAGTASLNTPAAAGAAVVAAGTLLALGRIPFSVIAGRIGLVGLAVLPVVLAVPFTAGPGWDFGPLHLSHRGLGTAAGITLRAVAVGLFALVLSHTTPPPRLFAAAHAVGVPGALVQLLGLAHRYIYVLAAEARRVRVALRGRGFRVRTDAHTYRTLGNAVGGLLVRGADRADAVAAAMRCRGFTGTYRPADPFAATAGDRAGFLIIAAGAIALVVADRILS